MKRQHGQSAVEFALMAPFVVIMILAMIYAGIMFMDYLNFNNHARTIARRISVATPGDRAILMDRYNEFTDKAAGVYNVSFEVKYDDDTKPADVIVTVKFTRGGDYLFFIMPQKFAIVYRMKLEDTSDPSPSTT